MAKKEKTKATKPRAATVEKHVARIKAVAAKHGGVLPSVKWLNDNGFWGSYHFLMIHAPKTIAGMKRKFERGEKTAPKARTRKAPQTKRAKSSTPRKSRARKLDTSEAQAAPADEFAAA